MSLLECQGVVKIVDGEVDEGVYACAEEDDIAVDVG